MRTHNAYERVIVDDVFDFARATFMSSGSDLRSQPQRLSCREYRFSFPDAVSHLISLSGAFEISDFFDGYHDENIYFNSPHQYLPNMTDPWKFNHEHHSRHRRVDNTRHESF
jgi:esterase/lipase superfamily enzyme